MRERVRIASRFMRGIMFNPDGTQTPVDTDQIDCTTPSGRDRKWRLESLLFRRARPH